MDLSMAPPPRTVNEDPSTKQGPTPFLVKAALRSPETLGYINWLESEPIRL
jgi:hypothetical protein